MVYHRLLESLIEINNLNNFLIFLGYKPSVNVVLLEDIAAVLGVGIAASCMTYSHFTGMKLFLNKFIKIVIL